MQSWVQKYKSAWTIWGKQRVLEQFGQDVVKSLWAGNISGFIHVVGGNGPASLSCVLDDTIEAQIPALLRKKPEIVTALLTQSYCLPSMFQNVIPEDVAIATQIFIDRNEWQNIETLLQQGTYPFPYRLYPQVVSEIASPSFVALLDASETRLSGEKGPATRFFKQGILSGDPVVDLKRLYNLRRMVSVETYYGDVRSAAQHIMEKVVENGDSAVMADFVKRLGREADEDEVQHDIGEDLEFFAYGTVSWIPARKISQTLIDGKETEAYLRFISVMEVLSDKHMNYIPPETVQQCAELLVDAGNVNHFTELMDIVAGHERLASQIRPSYVGKIAAKIHEEGDTVAQRALVSAVSASSRWERALPQAYRDLHWVFIPAQKDTHIYNIAMRFSEASDMEIFSGCLHKKGFQSLQEHWSAHADPQRRSQALPLVQDVLLSLASETRVDAPHVLFSPSRKILAGLAARELG